MESRYEPMVVQARFVPNPVFVGEETVLTVAAEDLLAVPKDEVRTSGEFSSGEV